jgi:hypothetical protein
LESAAIAVEMPFAVVGRADAELPDRPVSREVRPAEDERRRAANDQILVMPRLAAESLKPFATVSCSR